MTRRLAAIALGLSLLLEAPLLMANEPQTGSWGDQGDGTYLNPILNADYPDVDIEELDGVYYMITSTMTYAPGMTILESRDLVNWTIIGHMWDKLNWSPAFNWDRMEQYGNGVWAADLARHDDKWYCYFIDFRNGLYVSWTHDIRGPWSEPKCLWKKSNWDDPGVFWDEEEHQAYLVCNFMRDHKAPGIEKGLTENRVIKLSWDGLSLEDEGTPIYHGKGAEAAKIYKFDGLFYIFMGQWFGDDRKQIVLRGKSIYGPFERKILLERNRGSAMADRDRPVCQGSIIQVPDGSWWLTHQAVQQRLPGDATRSFEGRSQWLEPVTWKDGWPVVGHDPDANGVGNAMAGTRVPIAGHPLAAPQTDDEFDSPQLGHQWQWNHNPRDDFWSLIERPGWLRLKAAKPIKDGGFWNASNTLSQRLMGTGKGSATTRIDISAMAPGQQAGFCRHSGQYMLLGVKVDAGGTRRLFFDNNGKEEVGPVIESDTIFFRTDNDGRDATFSYSVAGESWERFGDAFELKFGRWRGDRIGIFCWNESEPKGHIDIEWFHYDYDGPKS